MDEKVKSDIKLFLLKTEAEAKTLQEKINKIEDDLGAYELDFENYIQEIIKCCKDYKHIWN